MTKLPITCSTVKDLPGKPSCCGSCHDDANNYGYWMSGDEENFDVCCAVGMWLKKQYGVDLHEPPPHSLLEALK